MRFEQALEKAKETALQRMVDLDEDIFLIRDLHGRFRVLLAKKRDGNSPYFPHHRALEADLAGALGSFSYAADDLLMYRDQLKHVNLPDAQTATLLAEKDGRKVYLHDRLLVGSGWDAAPVEEVAKPRRFTLFSMKGGVGRSTTTAILAYYLAKQGKRVLVLDLDLESPGIGATLLPAGNLPRYGIVDWFVEDLLNQGDSLIPEMIGESPLMDSLPGRIAVVPAFGSETGDYLPKLGRAYLEKGQTSWPQRLSGLVRELESSERPDVVLLDSRTGLHDTSAALILAMGAHTLMFAVDSRQTWTAYRYLFRHWASHPRVRDFRDKLWVVGSMIPETDQGTYLEGLCEHAWDLFLELYDQVEGVADADTFSFDQMDEAGNHFPRPILWQRALQNFDPFSALTEQLVEAAYGSFLHWFEDTLSSEEVTP